MQEADIISRVRPQNVETSGIQNGFEMGQIYILNYMCQESTFVGEKKLEIRVETHVTKSWLSRSRYHQHNSQYSVFIFSE